MNSVIEGKELSISGRFLKTARLRHEWCDFLQDAPSALQAMRTQKPVADLFTFVNDIGDTRQDCSYHNEPVANAVLPVTTFAKWWDEIGFKPRNKIRKAQKTGVEIRLASLDETFAKGVEAIYNESAIRQGRKFSHYGKKAPEIQNELTSFQDRSILVGAYFQDELIGFMKLFEGKQVLRTVHIIAKLSHREKCAMDVMISKAVELCEQKKAVYLHYGSWTDGGVGVFREKHGFQRMEVPRYFVPLSLRGEMMLKLNLHRPMRERLPKGLVGQIVALRSKWNSLKFKRPKVEVET